MFKKLFFSFFFLFFLSNLVLAISVAPAAIRADFSPNKEQSFSMHFASTGGKYIEIEIEGVLEPYITINGGLIQECDNACHITGKINFPEEIISVPPGQHSTIVYGKKANPESSFMGALPRVGVRLNSLILTDGPFLKIESIITQDSRTKFVEGEIINFFVTIKNYGNFKAENIDGLLQIYPIPSRSNYYNISLDDIGIIEAGETIVLQKYFETQGLPWGRYQLLGEIEYMSFNRSMSNDFILRSFQVGDKVVEVRSLSTTSFRAGSINKFSAQLYNHWMDPLTVYVDFELLNNDVVLTRSSSRSVRIEEVSSVDGFLDFSSIQEGNYTLRTITNYDGESHTQIFDVTLSQDSKAEVVDRMPLAPEFLFLLGTIAVLLFVIVILLVVILFSRKGDKNKNKK